MQWFLVVMKGAIQIFTMDKSAFAESSFPR